MILLRKHFKTLVNNLSKYGCDHSRTNKSMDKVTAVSLQGKRTKYD